MPFSEEISTNVELLEQRSGDIAQQEMDRSRGLDQKTAGLIAAGLALVGAAVAFASRIGGLGVGPGARTFWAILVVLGLFLVLASLGFATAAVRPQAFRIVIHMDELGRWGTARMLDRDPIQVRGELMAANVAAVREARAINKRKGNRLAVAFSFFAAAIVATVLLGSAVAIRLAETQSHHDPRREQPAAKQSVSRRGRAPAAGRRPSRVHLHR